jgi:hypothetical protein
MGGVGASIFAAVVLAVLAAAGMAPGTLKAAAAAATPNRLRRSTPPLVARVIGCPLHRFLLFVGQVHPDCHAAITDFFPNIGPNCLAVSI